VAAGGSTGQFLSKASGTSYDTTWATIVPGDRYLTTSTTSLTINNSNKTLTVGTGLSYTTTQNVTIAYDASNHMHGEVLTYNSGTGVMTVDENHHTGTGTYAAWVVNVGGVTPVTSTTWGSITGTLSSQTDLQTALDAKLAKASNLSDLVSAPTARTNLGLGTAAVEPATKLVPSGGTTGQVLSKVSATSWDLVWATAGGGGGGSTITSYLTPGTYSYTIPAGANFLKVFLWGSGGPGGSGCRNATTVARSGGSGGGNGSCIVYDFPASDFTSPVTVVVSAGPAGAAAQTVNNSVGINGTPSATNTSFGNYVSSNGNAGLGGTTIAVAGGAGKLNVLSFISAAGGAGGNGQPSSGLNGGVLNGFNIMSPSGGGGGGGQSANNTNSSPGGTGGNKSQAAPNNQPGYNVNVVGGAGGNPPSTFPTNGPSLGGYFGGLGGGGGGYRTGVAGQNGANGGFPGGGGGGGSASDNGFNSGAGGAGANGAAIVIAY
jgi:hypothetical protein